MLKCDETFCIEEMISETINVRHQIRLLVVTFRSGYMSWQRNMKYRVILFRVMAGGVTAYWR